MIAVSVEQKAGGEAMAWVMELPYPSGQGASREEALRDLRTALDWTRAWLRDKGFGAALPEGDFEPAETVEAHDYPETGDTDGFFAEDRKPADAAYVRSVLPLLHAAHEDFRAAAYRRLQEANDERIRWAVKHVGQAEWWYASRIPGSPGDLGDPPQSDDPFDTLDRARRMFREEFVPFVERMEKRDAPVERDGETWTARKAFRRALWHVLYHLRRVDR